MTQLIHVDPNSAVNPPETIFAEYICLREKGMDDRACLNTLRSVIEPLSLTQRDTLLRFMRAWENRHVATRDLPVTERPTQLRPPSGIKRLADARASMTAEQPAVRPNGIKRLGQH